MSERITLISLLNKENLNKIESIVNKIKYPLCKVPFGKNIDDRYITDTLPYHFTISAWDIKNEDFVINKLSKIQFNKFNVLIDSIKIMDGKEDSFVLYFNVVINEKLKSLQEQIYNILPSEKYNPNSFKFHITITIDKNYKKIIDIKNDLEEYFSPFELEVNAIGLFEIYPAKLVKELKSN